DCLSKARDPLDMPWPLVGHRRAAPSGHNATVTVPFNPLSPARSGAFSLETAPRFPSNHYGTSRLFVRHGRREKSRYDTLLLSTLLSTATCSQKKGTLRPTQRYLVSVRREG